jgi:hypothetical protein
MTVDPNQPQTDQGATPDPSVNILDLIPEPGTEPQGDPGDEHDDPDPAATPKPDEDEDEEESKFQAELQRRGLVAMPQDQAIDSIIAAITKPKADDDGNADEEIDSDDDETDDAYLRMTNPAEYEKKVRERAVRDVSSHASLVDQLTDDIRAIPEMDEDDIREARAKFRGMSLEALKRVRQANSHVVLAKNYAYDKRSTMSDKKNPPNPAKTNKATERPPAKVEKKEDDPNASVKQSMMSRIHRKLGVSQGDE